MEQIQLSEIVQNRIAKYLEDFDEIDIILERLRNRIILLFFLRSQVDQEIFQTNSDLVQVILEQILEDDLIPQRKIFYNIFVNLIQQIIVLQIDSEILLKVFEIIPFNVWEEIFTELAKYKWGLNESSGNKEILTPFLFGHLFEQTTHQKQTGTFYTPTHISENITQDTIHHALLNRMIRQFHDLCCTELWDFFDNFSPESDLPIIRYLYWELLPNFSIADIACGSGEFLLAALKVFTPIYQQCIGFLQETPEFLEEQANIDYFPNQLSFIKYNILSNNIYGVDLQSGGVECAKLRLLLNWISECKIADWEKLNTWPTLDAHLKTGNSLIGDINENAYKKSKIQQTLNGYVSIDNLNITEKTEEFNWAQDAPQVFAYGGFDVIVGNPPYGQNSITPEMREKLERNWQPFSLGKKGQGRTYNIAAIFIERIHYLLRDTGEFGLIVNNSIARVEEFTGIRQFLLAHGQIRKIIDEGNPFKDSKVTLEMLDLFYVKQTVSEYLITVQNNREGRGEKSEQIPVEIWHRYSRFILYPDEIFDWIYSHAQIGIIQGTRGRDAQKTSEKQPGFEIPYVFSGKSVHKFQIKLSEIEYAKNDLKEKSTWFAELMQNYLLITTKITDRYRITLKPAGFLVGNNVIKITTTEINLDPLVIMAILNSKLLDFIVKRYIINESELTTAFYNSITEFTPLRVPHNGGVYRRLAEYLLLLGIKDSSDSFAFFQQILNLLVCELYFSEKFEPPLKQSLETLLLPQLEPIPFDQLYSDYWTEAISIEFDHCMSDPLAARFEEITNIIDQVKFRIQNEIELQSIIEELSEKDWLQTFLEIN